MKTYIYIYILETSPKKYTVINVDNEQDKNMLKAQGAYEMPAEMVSSIFGENARYADNTTCTVAENAENPVFPFTVTFDASKIVQNMPLHSFGTLKLIETRNKNGIVTLTGLIIGKPVVMTYSSSSTSTTSAIGYKVISGSNDALSGLSSIASTGFRLGWLDQDRMNSSALFIPTAKTMVLELSRFDVYPKGIVYFYH